MQAAGDGLKKPEAAWAARHQNTPARGPHSWTMQQRAWQSAMFCLQTAGWGSHQMDRIMV